MKNSYNYKLKKRRQFNIYIFTACIFLSVVFMGFSFSYFSDTLIINGSTTLKPGYRPLDLDLDIATDVTVRVDGTYLKYWESKKYKKDTLISFIEMGPDGGVEQDIVLSFNFKNKMPRELHKGHVEAKVTKGNKEAITFRYEPSVTIDVSGTYPDKLTDPTGVFLAYLPIDPKKVLSDTIVKYDIIYEVDPTRKGQGNGKKPIPKSFSYYVVITKPGFEKYELYKSYIDSNKKKGNKLVKNIIEERPNKAKLLEPFKMQDNHSNMVIENVISNTVNNSVINNVVSNKVVENIVSNNVNESNKISNQTNKNTNVNKNENKVESNTVLPEVNSKEPVKEPTTNTSDLKKTNNNNDVQNKVDENSSVINK